MRSWQSTPSSPQQLDQLSEVLRELQRTRKTVMLRGLVRARRRQRQVHDSGWFCWCVAVCVVLRWSAGPPAGLHHGRYRPEGQLWCG